MTRQKKSTVPPADEPIQRALQQIQSLATAAKDEYFTHKLHLIVCDIHDRATRALHWLAHRPLARTAADDQATTQEVTHEN